MIFDKDLMGFLIGIDRMFDQGFDLSVDRDLKGYWIMVLIRFFVWN